VYDTTEMSKVHIFGLDHFHQNLETGCCTPAGVADEQEQKSRLADTLGEIIMQNGVDLVAEEGKLDRSCLGHRLAQEYGIEHIDITIPIEEREKHGVKTPHYDVQQTTRKVAYQIFEQYMFDQVKTHEAEVILIMCGLRHFRALEKLFTTAGDDVRVYDINDYPWYRGIPQEGEQGVIGYEREP
jgi:hypothetical protein